MIMKSFKGKEAYEAEIVVTVRARMLTAGDAVDLITTLQDFSSELDYGIDLSEVYPGDTDCMPTYGDLK